MMISFFPSSLGMLAPLPWYFPSQVTPAPTTYLLCEKTMQNAPNQTTPPQRYNSSWLPSSMKPPRLLHFIMMTSPFIKMYHYDPPFTSHAYVLFPMLNLETDYIAFPTPFLLLALLSTLTGLTLSFFLTVSQVVPSPFPISADLPCKPSVP
jgi:hypothetical protein